MSREHWLLSVAIAFHLAALTLAALPPVETLERFSDRRFETLDRPVEKFLLSAADLAHDTEQVVLSASGPLRRVTQVYIDAGLRQKWNMFSDPGIFDRYLRVDHYFRRDGVEFVYQEIVFPADDESRIKLVHRFQDKAAFNALTDFELATRRQNLNRVPSTTLAPIAHHYARLFWTAERVPQASRGRTEIWYGQATIPPPATPQTPEQLRERLAKLARYRTPQSRPAAPTAGFVGLKEHEADISWTLFHVQYPQ